MTLSNKIAIGCLIQWYEIEIIEEYLQSVKNAVDLIDNKDQAIDTIMYIASSWGINIPSNVTEAKKDEKDKESLEEGSEDQYPSFELNKNIKYQDMRITSGYWTYTGKESGGRGVYLNVMNQQRLGFNVDDINFFKTRLPNHFKLEDLGHFKLEEAKKDKEEEEDIEIEDIEDIEGVEDVEIEDTPSPDVSGITGDEKKVQDSLESALIAAKELGDEKLINQIGNSITFFTRSHVVGSGDENIEEDFTSEDKQELNEGKDVVLSLIDDLNKYMNGDLDKKDIQSSIEIFSTELRNSLFEGGNLEEEVESYQEDLYERKKMLKIAGIIK